jgi:hypothetical protein
MFGYLCQDSAMTSGDFTTLSSPANGSTVAQSARSAPFFDSCLLVAGALVSVFGQRHARTLTLFYVLCCVSYPPLVPPPQPA